MKECAEAHDVPGLVRLAGEQTDRLERSFLYGSTMRSLANKPWEGKSLDVMIALGEHGIADALAAADDFPAMRTTLRDRANVLAYNLAANLADCWGDDFPREPRHFEKGLELAERCLSFRRELNKGPGPFAMAYWVKGKHELSLDRCADALRSFQTSLEKEVEAALAEEKPSAGEGTAISECLDTPMATTPFAVLLAHGYVALAMMGVGPGPGDAQYQRVCKAFQEQKELSAEAREDAEFALDQLGRVATAVRIRRGG